MVYKLRAVRGALTASSRPALPVFRCMKVVAVAVVMWESRRDFQGVWEEWKAGFMAIHPFPTPSFPWLFFWRNWSFRVAAIRLQTQEISKMPVSQI